MRLQAALLEVPDRRRLTLLSYIQRLGRLPTLPWASPTHAAASAALSAFCRFVRCGVRCIVCLQFTTVYSVVCRERKHERARRERDGDGPVGSRRAGLAVALALPTLTRRVERAEIKRKISEPCRTWPGEERIHTHRVLFITAPRAAPHTHHRLRPLHRHLRAAGTAARPALPARPPPPRIASR